MTRMVYSVADDSAPENPRDQLVRLAADRRWKPKFITAAYSSRCSLCGEPIWTGEKLAWSSAPRLALHIDCANGVLTEALELRKREARTA